MSETWAWASHSPVFFLLLTLVAYRIGREVRDRTGGHALAQPVLVAIVLVGVTLSVLDVDYADYADGTTLISFLLGPATVALAVPLHRQAHRLQGFVVPLLVAIPLGAVVSVSTAVVLVETSVVATSSPARSPRRRPRPRSRSPCRRRQAGSRR